MRAVAQAADPLDIDAEIKGGAEGRRELATEKILPEICEINDEGGVT